MSDLEEALDAKIIRYQRVNSCLEELIQLKKDAYFMRTVIHELGMVRDWTDEQAKARMEEILYDPQTNKLRM